MVFWVECLWSATVATALPAIAADLGQVERVSWVVVAYLVALVATGSILASIHNSMNERRREIAIVRALGAHRRTGPPEPGSQAG